MQYKKDTLKAYPPALEEMYKAMGADLFKAEGRLVDAHTVSAGDKKITGEYIVIGTGERAKRQNVPGQEYIHDSTDLLSRDEFPKRLVLIGAGIISMEFAAMAVKMGGETTIIQYNDRVLSMYPKKYTERITAKLKAEGARFCFNESVARIDKAGDAFKVTLKSGAVIECDYILEATGRRANCDNLGLEDVGIDFSEKGIKVNEYLQSSVPNIYASGDVIDKRIPRLTPTASFESIYIAEHILGKKDPICYPAVPNLVFTLPRIAQVGVTVAEAEKNPAKYRIEVVPYGKAMLFDSSNEADNEFTFIFDGDNYLVGAAFYGTEAASLVNFVTFIINKKITGEELDHMIFAFPTQTYGAYSMLASLMTK